MKKWGTPISPICYSMYTAAGAHCVVGFCFGKSDSRERGYRALSSTPVPLPSCPGPTAASCCDARGGTTRHRSSHGLAAARSRDPIPFPRTTHPPRSSRPQLGPPDTSTPSPRPGPFTSGPHVPRAPRVTARGGRKPRSASLPSAAHETPPWSQAPGLVTKGSLCLRKEWGAGSTKAKKRSVQNVSFSQLRAFSPAWRRSLKVVAGEDRLSGFLGLSFSFIKILLFW